MKREQVSLSLRSTGAVRGGGGFAALTPARRRKLALDLAKIAGAVAPIPGAGEASAKAEFPAFVADLLHGVFEAIVNASVAQMDAYAKLVADVAKTVDQFMEENVSGAEGRDYLADDFPGENYAGEYETSASSPKKPRRRARRAKPRPRTTNRAALMRMALHAATLRAAQKPITAVTARRRSRASP